jgi:hypothetical protein
VLPEAQLMQHPRAAGSSWFCMLLIHSSQNHWSCSSWFANTVDGYGMQRQVTPLLLCKCNYQGVSLLVPNPFHSVVWFMSKLACAGSRTWTRHLAHWRAEKPQKAPYMWGVLHFLDQCVVAGRIHRSRARPDGRSGTKQKGCQVWATGLLPLCLMDAGCADGQIIIFGQPASDVKPAAAACSHLADLPVQSACTRHGNGSQPSSSLKGCPWSTRLPGRLCVLPVPSEPRPAMTLHRRV